MAASLSQLLQGVPVLAITGDTTQQITKLCLDSRQVQPGSLFAAVRGTQTDGHQFIAKAVELGATVIVCEQLPETQVASVVYIQVSDSAKTLGFIASNFYGNPSEKLKLVAVTGTNGKTTTVTLLYQLFRRLGYRTGMLSTVRNYIDDKPVEATHTTPDAINLNALLADMVTAGCTHAFMEASSHAIVQERTAGVKFTGAIFTNITHDHLDFHQTFDNYIKAKKKLFDELPSSAFALANLDDKRGLIILQNTSARKATFSLVNPAPFKGRLIANTLHGLEMEIEGKEVWFKLIGEFNAYNILGVYATAILLGEPIEEVLMQLSDVLPAPGRFDQVRSAEGVIGIVDYAHTPDALENVLETIQELKDGGKVITIVGCGGNRDAAKRPVMAEIACKLSDKILLTSDNPRFEEPEAILADMEKGVKITDRNRVQTIVDRKEAIAKAVAMAQPGDIILIAGKGHETYQEIKGVKYPFDDKKIITELFEA
ncbi:UDP-N-acetylmuramoyl-L-alanyl-D-glutamate--2,6-diaminopimelate ligase [Cytophagaceae bacterium DM2B3-1]|uniref:UDP-N-acetylmuramoyl-L-alanyl-D-glutamate--2,6-diaminopimelate ligase n=1 Tax=Xanthocytophaga flava TaxID=3048013 RepID=A0ABT7CHY5_9BACT|nr:UDP-N-acetylmuramoyl-L-alanyl-D-glutamate--2,6-diaminopimelate ligase [Xanthocytophaga flavus]MDJ1493287.1 UDP-N-acetylmuramoyl-L-alanyl-D-glutamate--2,6-diaminopimelate ligase [Xanthocytophaga flavus]